MRRTRGERRSADLRRWSSVRALPLIMAMALPVVLPGCAGDCGGGAQPTIAGPSQEELKRCQDERDRLQAENNQLKVKLAQALANPGTIKVDPSLLQIEGRSIAQEVQEGTLSQEEVYGVIGRSRGSLQDCYTRALKRNSTLQHSSITLSLSFTIKNSGQPTDISIEPNRDRQMIDCMTRAIQRWKFPAFEGRPVGVESPVTLTPKQ